MEASSFLRPIRFRVARHFPLFPLLTKYRIQSLSQGLEVLLVLLPYNVDLRVVRDGLEGNSRHPLVHKALSDISSRGPSCDIRSRDLGLLSQTFRTIRKQVIGIPSSHEASSRQS